MIGKADSMFYIVFAWGLFISSVIVHILFCRRTNRAGLQAKAYVFIGLIFLGIYAGGVLALKNQTYEDIRLGL